MWLLGGGGGDSAYKTTIEEANKHLNALSKRIEELEAALEEQKAEMERREVIYTESVKELHELRDQETATLSAKVKEYGSTIRCLESDLRRRDTELNILRQRCRILDEILRYKASLAKLTITLEQAEQYSKSVYRTTQDQRLAGASEVMVHVDPTPRPTKSIEYLVDDVPDDEIVDRVGEAYVNGEREKLKKSVPTLAEKAAKTEVMP
uniref:Vimentin-type intermediate filament-associated coiled-coil protein n=1 Tax=Schistocephalus solidus TaxID=70667 RepID=A0A0X3PEF3_SCHSO